MKKLPARYAIIVSPLILSLLMTSIVSFVSTVNSIGLTPDLASKWVSAWAFSWLLAFPTLLFVLPLVRRIVGWLCMPASQ